MNNTEIINAARELGIPACDIDDLYQGKYFSHEAFARAHARSTDALSNNEPWPYNCIDWTEAAEQIMYDAFQEQNKHYFRQQANEQKI